LNSTSSLHQLTADQIQWNSAVMETLDGSGAHGEIEDEHSRAAWNRKVDTEIALCDARIDERHAIVRRIEAEAAHRTAHLLSWLGSTRRVQ
jgi:hypothetical protein